MKCLLGLAAYVLPLLAYAEYVVPVTSVEDHVNVRMVADAKSEVVGRLYRGDAAKLVKPGTEWHEIEIAGGATGFISADWTIVVDKNPQLATAAEPSRSIVRTNVAELTPEEALAALENLNPVTFNYRANDHERYVGFTAGNVPDLVAESETEGLKPLEIVAVLTRVVKLQQDRIAELESRLAEPD